MYQFNALKGDINALLIIKSICVKSTAFLNALLVFTELPSSPISMVHNGLSLFPMK
jgi:hypothetical protein